MPVSMFSRVRKVNVMSRSDSARPSKAWLALAAALSLTACAQRAPEPPAVAAQGIPPKVTIVASSQHHVIFVDPRSGRISHYSRAGFDAFLAQVSPGNPEAIHLQLRGPLSGKALAAVSDAAVADGVSRPKISLVPTSPEPGKHRYDVAVQVESVVYTVQPPSCPRTSHTTIGDMENTPSSDFGCAFVSNTSAMIADPRDLVRGEQLGDTDGAVTSGAIQRLRDDKVKPFLLDNSFSSGGGS
jgi:pilus biogenesis lipoprotein CpaD